MFDWITNLVGQSGYIGIALLMFVENLFPPIPSEVIMPLAGFNAAQGSLNVFLVVAAGSIGSLTGAVIWYYIGLWLGLGRLKKWTARAGRWLTLHPDDIDKAADWFQRHGGAAVFFARLVPAVRTVISVPAGIAGMPLLPFLIYSAAGTVLWTALLTGAGYLLQSQYEAIAGWVNPLTNIILVVLAVIYIYRVVTFDASKARE